MSEQIGHWRATYTPGKWVVLAGPTSLVVLQPAPPRFSSMINSFWDVIVQADSLDSLIGELARYNVERMPDFAAFFWHGGEMRSLVRGDIRVMNLDTGDVIAVGDGMQTWAETGLGAVRRVRVDMEDANIDEMLQLPLVVGGVAASVVQLDANEDAVVASPQGLQGHGAPDGNYGRPPEPARPTMFGSAPVSNDAPDGGMDMPFPVSRSGGRRPMPGPDGEGHSISRGPHGLGASASSAASASPPPSSNPFAPPPGQAPFRQGQGGPPQQYSRQNEQAGHGPQTRQHDQWTPAADQGDADGDMVLGVVCGAGHPNPPETQRCRRCGNPLQGQPRMMDRPLLAVLRPSSGQPVEVDRSVLIGRSPQANKVPREELPRLMTVVSPSHDISRTHVQISPEGWDVMATDLHSTNGTHLIRPGQPDPQRLPPGEPVTVFPGCVLDLGDGVTILVDHPA